ncbi:DUF4192 family protein [Corynebacterium auriscanis]|uniref:DUF4192 family protein n=1 Tax=Corynebacterium auriscanis TaxID=99807 RepID=UPI00068BEC12|nr:DUF4192 family protein [Corynebacterium auriscanis]MCX2162971.1 DUF4192 domain-containing protein [Corynebacterium auriscanis]WJY72831.1 hypothetical protein CAURIC_06025 [Corynebacterium auriscanis]
MTSFKDFADILNNRLEREGIPAGQLDDSSGSSAHSRTVNLGSDPGALLASLPALLGFVPTQSLVVVGLVPTMAGEPARMTVGPVVRVDFDKGAVREGVQTLIEAMQSDDGIELEACEAILIGIGSPGKKRSRAMAQARGILEEHYLTINGHFLVKQLATGAIWRESNTNTSGHVGSIDDNPLQNIATLAGALRLNNRDEMEHWLDQREDPLDLLAQRCVLGCQLEEAEECRAESHGLCSQGPGDVGDVVRLYETIAAVKEGKRSVEDACDDVDVLTRVTYLALSEVLHTTIIVAGAGVNAPIVREILAAAARRTEATPRWRLMALLAVVLGGNDEGTVAFSTLLRTMNELDTVCEDDAVTVGLTISAIGAHHRGKTRDLLRLALERGTHVLAACHDELTLAVDLGASVDEFLSDFDACLDILDIEFLKGAGAFDGHGGNNNDLRPEQRRGAGYEQPGS